MAAVHGLVRAHAISHGIPANEADEFFARVQSAASLQGGVQEFTDPAQVMHVAVRLWTSAYTLRGRELCSVLNEAIRNDEPAVVFHAVVITKAICEFCVKRRRRSAASLRWPPTNCTYRGGAIDSGAVNSVKF